MFVYINVFHFTPVKAVTQSHCNKSFDTVLPVNADAW